ncbi:MAG TPA: AAA family ATPase, partial [Candidatus Bilamarchaeaceae archaeon]|nr:AAA family ATPase [Candidatus Bilamarchaeaceae archaeon]
KKEILIGTNKKLPGVIEITEELATFIGLWIAEGSYNYGHVVRISTSEDEHKKIIDICKKLFGNAKAYKKAGTKGVDIYIPSRPLYVLFRYLFGLRDGAENKKVPEVAFAFSKSNMSALLRGYFSGDGTFYKNQRIGIVEASTTSKQLANDLLYLLLYFQIVASKYQKKERKGKDAERITFSGSKWLSRFSEIGFLDEKRAHKLQDYIKSIKWTRSEQIPISGRLRDIVTQHLPKWSASATIGKQMLSNSEFSEELEFMETIENDVYLDRVEEIKEVENEEFVYDIAVDPCQNFVAGVGGIFAHNSEKNVNEVFEIARKSAPAILFFDEIDSIGKSRTLQSDDVGQRVLTALLQQMDGGLKGKQPVIVIGATNVPQQLDPALMRPGRLDKIIYMHLPDPKAREAIFKVHLKKLPIADIDYAKLVEKTNRFSGADLKNVVNEAIKITAKEATAKGVVMPVTTEHIMEVVSRVRPSTSLASMDDYDQFRLDFERRVGAQKEEKKKDAITWDQVAGLGKVKKALLDTIELPLLHEEEMKELKIKPAKGILLFGPPGTGKTLIVKAASSELKASFQSLSGAEVMKKGYTQAVIVIKEVFNRARENTPAIVFVDEIETIAPARGDYSSGLTGQFLTEMDGMKDSKGVVVIATTNKPDLLDSAILRPGRFDKIFYISPPDAEGRGEIFKIHLGKLAEKIDTNELAKVTEGFSGADIASACQNLKMKALEQKIGGKEINITTSDAVELLSKRRPSVTPKMLVEYEKFIKEYGERT